jgi:hypothetical protein
MSSDAVITAPDLTDWVGRAEAARIVGVAPAYVLNAAVKHRISTQIMFGVAKFYRPDCERAAKAIAEMRAKRDGVSA